MTETPPATTDVHILLVEDNEADVDLMTEAFAQRAHTRLSVARTGEDAMAMIRDASRENKPDLVLLDLNLPRKSGFEVLAELKEDPRSRAIPVLILSSSNAESDIARAYAAHANSYFRKPIGIGPLFGMAKSVEEYWTNHAQLPPKAASS